MQMVNNGTDNLYEIISVKEVSGKSLCVYWKTNMQLITTDRGVYIDNLPGISHGSTPKGHDWKQEMGKKIFAVTSKDKNTPNTWIFISDELKKPQKNTTISEKLDLPPDYNLNDNKELKQAYEYIKQGFPIIFLTGGAGTGKSTFIKYLKVNLKKDLNKNYVVLAPTGVAAINVGGQTIHSFFRWNTDVFDDKKVTKGSYKNQIIDHSDLIIIDEISMVHSWMIDHIDYALRLWCDKSKPFGGKQLLLIGDCFQLPPVLNNDDLDKKKYYDQWESPFFFAAKAFKNFEKNEIKALQLKKIYRQEKDQIFIQILNRIRECKTGYEHDIEYLNNHCLIESRLGTKNVPPESLLLCTTNSKADDFNNKRIAKLENNGAKKSIFNAIIKGDFNHDSVLTPTSLEICVGSKIMVTKNINSQNLVNGDMGKVLEFGGSGNSIDDYVIIEVNGNKYRLARETWENLKYKWDDNTKTIIQTTTGTFNQIPLKLGWAVTIHKSQGLTLDSVAIDASDAWDSGQVYVALSRAKSLNGVLLCNELPLSAIKVDSLVQEKYRELFPEEDNSQANIDYPATLTNSIFTIDKSDELSNVKIGDFVFELTPDKDEKIGEFARKTISKLLLNKLIPNAEIKKLLEDEEYSFTTFGICYVFPTRTLKFPLLIQNRADNDNKKRYWATEYNGYYICSQWYPKCQSKLSNWLIHLSRGDFDHDN